MTITKTAPPKRSAREERALEIDREYQEKAKSALREAVGSDYPGLAAKLNAMGIDITARGLENKIARGTFSAAFMLQCMTAAGGQVELTTE